MKKQSGRIVIISSPSGGGKTSICRKLLNPSRRKKGWRFSVSYTTRKPRIGERNGREYYFVDEQMFVDLETKGFFAEAFRVHGFRYGTPRKPIEKIRRQGGVMLFDVDVQGAGRLYREYPDAISIFVLPPSVTALKQRLNKRGTETVEQLRLRFTNAIREIRTFRKYKFDYVVINDDLQRAVNQVQAIIEAHRCRIDRIDPEQIEKIVG